MTQAQRYDAFVNGITGSALKRDALPFKMGAGK